MTLYYWLFSQIYASRNYVGKGNTNAYTMGLYREVLKGLSFAGTMHLANTLLYI